MKNQKIICDVCHKPFKTDNALELDRWILHPECHCLAIEQLKPFFNTLEQLKSFFDILFRPEASGESG